MKRPLPDLDLYLAHAFIAYPNAWATLAARGADRVLVETAWFPFASKLPSNIAAYSNAFGPPVEERDGVYHWALTLWPDHYWRVAFQDIPAMGDRAPLGLCEIARRVPGRPERVSPLSVAGAVRALRFGDDTFEDVTIALGEHVRYDGWWPWESWGYDLPDGSPLQCVFVHGLVVAIDQDPMRDAIWRQTPASPTDPVSS